MRHILLGIRELKELYTSGNITKVIVDTINDYKIKARIGVFITNNASSNDTIVSSIL